MKIFLSFILFFYLLTISLFAQISNDVKMKVDAFPKKMESPSIMAALINYKFINDEDKVGAIYYWMANNIKFDTKAHFNKSKKVTYNFRYKTHEEKLQKIQKTNWEIAETVFKKQKGVSKEYAFLFKKLTNNCGIECEIVKGTSKVSPKSIGRKPGRTDHYWNAVKLNNRWCLVDVTWGAGILDEEAKKFEHEYNETFFMTSPELFCLNHYPKDKKWLLTNQSKEEFGILPLFYPSYINGGFELIEPVTGVITSTEGNTLKIFMHLNENLVKSSVDSAFAYTFKNDKKAKILKANINGERVKLDISLLDRKYDLLTVYFQGSPLVAFKIKKKSY